MRNIKVKNLKTTHLCKDNYEKKYQSFIQPTGAEAFVKPTLEMHVLQSLQGHFSGFTFLILILKTLELGMFL